MRLKKILTILFRTWLTTLVIFSGLVAYGMLIEPLDAKSAGYQGLLSYGALGAVLVGSAAFSILWIVSLITLFYKKRRNVGFAFLRKSTGITIAWLACLVVVVWLAPKPEFAQPAGNSQHQNYSGPMSFDLPDPIIQPSPTPQPQAPIDPYANDPDLKDAEWGVAVEVAEHTYRMKIQEDDTMSTANELYQALNTYRATKGKSRLDWHDGLAEIARARVVEQHSDSYAHEGFIRRIEEENVPDSVKERFYNFGENASVGYRFSGTHLIEWMYAGDAGHDNNQLGKWSHVGVAINGDDSVLIFASG